MALPVHTLRNLLSLAATAAFVAVVIGLAVALEPLAERMPG